MVTLTLATLENQLPLFIKSILDKNIVDTVTRTSPNQFVYKEAPTKPATQYPYIVVESDNSTSNQMSYEGSLRIQRDISVSIRVITKGQGSMLARDTLADSIIPLFYNTSTQDVSGATMDYNQLTITSARTSPTLYFSKDGDVIKMKEIKCIFRYRGG